MVKYTEQIADFVSKTTYDNLPENVRKQAKLVILDTFGCAIGTHWDEPEKPKIINEFVRSFNAKPEATVILGGFKTHSTLAAMANGVICHGIDFDDTHKEALTHTSCVIVPAALASAESAGLGGKELINSVVLGYEVAVRAGIAVMPTHYEFWHSTATNGAFGAAAAAGKNIGLSKDKIIDAFGLAGTQASGLLTYLEFGDYTKSFNPGKSALNGLFAALIAKAGATGPPVMLEHPKGYCHAYSKEPKIEKLNRGIPGTYEILLNAFKPYPSLLASHPPMDAVLKLVKENNIKPDEIVKITNHTYKTVKTHFSNYNPETVMAARLSVPYCIAVTAVDSEAGLSQFHLKKIKSQPVQDMLKKVEIIVDDELSKLYPEKFPARVIIETKNRGRFEHTVYYPKGDPNNPLSEDELKNKFRKLTGGVLDTKRVEALIDAIMSLEKAEDLKNLTSLLS